MVTIPKDLKCPDCGSHDIRIEKSEGQILVDGKVVQKYPVRNIVCNECGSLIIYKPLDNENKRNGNKAERKVLDGQYIVPFDVIKSLPKRYNIDRASFEIVMGINPTHQTDEGYYEDFNLWRGDIPNEKEEERLKMIADDPKNYVEFLKLAKGKIKDETYKRSMERAKQLAEK